MHLMIQLLILMRPKQWVKSLFCILPVFFTGKMFSSDLKLVILSVCVMSLASSCAYIYNDLSNIDQDKAHHSKKHRPLANGEVSKYQAVLLLFFLISVVVALISVTEIRGELLMGIAVYFIIQFFYTKFIRGVAYLDVILVSLGFMVRLYLGGIAAQSSVSLWLYSSVYFLALNIFIYKRLDEYSKMKEYSSLTRTIWSENALKNYRILSYLSFGLLMGVYMLYVRIEKNNIYGWLTVLVSLLILIRYVMASVITIDKERPYSVLYKDKIIIICSVIWILLHFKILYT